MPNINRQQFLILASVFCLVLAGWQWGVVPALDYRQDLEQRYELNAVRLKELLELKQQFQALKERASKGNDLQNKSPGFTLFSFLEELASRADVKKYIESMKPSTQSISEELTEDLVQMRLEGVRLAKLMRFIESVEHAGKGVFFERLTIRSARDKPGILRADLVAGTFRMEG